MIVARRVSAHEGMTHLFSPHSMQRSKRTVNIENLLQLPNVNRLEGNVHDMAGDCRRVLNETIPTPNSHFRIDSTNPLTSLTSASFSLIFAHTAGKSQLSTSCPSSSTSRTCTIALHNTKHTTKIAPVAIAPRVHCALHRFPHPAASTARAYFCRPCT